MTYMGNINKPKSCTTIRSGSTGASLAASFSGYFKSDPQGICAFHDNQTTHTYSNEVFIPFALMCSATRVGRATISCTNNKNITSKCKSAAAFDGWSYYYDATYFGGHSNSEMHNVMSGKPSAVSIEVADGYSTSVTVNIQNDSFIVRRFILGD